MLSLLFQVSYNHPLPPPPAIPARVAEAPQSEEVSGLTTGTMMCNYSVTPGCPFSIPPVPPQCVSVPCCTQLTHTHTHLVSHTQHKATAPSSVSLSGVSGLLDSPRHAGRERRTQTFLLISVNRGSHWSWRSWNITFY